MRAFRSIAECRQQGVGNGLPHFRVQCGASGQQLFHQVAQLPRPLRIKAPYRLFTGLRRAGLRRYFKADGVQVLTKGFCVNIGSGWHCAGFPGTISMLKR